MPSLRELARSVRHAPGLERMDFLWNAIRQPYYRLTTRNGSITMRLGGARVRFPASHAQYAWEDYERESMRAFVSWVHAHPTGFIADIGAAVGLYSHVALSLAPSARVLAVDADLASLRETMQLVRPTPQLDVVHGLVSDQGSGRNRVEAVAATRQELEAGPLDAPHYVCLGDAGTDGLPAYTVDELLAGLAEHTSLLLKIDIEGAELLALRGAMKTLARAKTTLLLSVHPYLMERYVHAPPDETVRMVERFLTDVGYRWTVIGIDNEQHWWCERAT